METLHNTSAPDAETPVTTPGSASDSAPPRKLAKVAIAFVDRSTDLKLLEASGRIVVGMNGNAKYPAPIPALDTLVAARGAFESAVHANDRSRAAVVRRDNARMALTAVVRGLALYVQQASQGDLQVLLTSGYPAQRSGSAAVALPAAPEQVRANPGRVSGQVVARCRRERDVASYQWRYATVAAPTVWTMPDPVTRASMTANGLTRGTDYLVQVRAIGARGPSDWSDTVQVMAM